MKIKRFTAKNMREAIRQVREEQGPDAVILSNRRTAQGIEIVAATDYDAALMQQALKTDTREQTVPLRSAPAAPATAKPAAARTAPAITAPAPKPVAADPGITELRRELSGVKTLIESQLAGLVWDNVNRRQPRRADALRALGQISLTPALAREIVGELPPQADGERARFLPLGLLARRIPIAKSDLVMEGGIIALVGATGVGKTTTIAKLAARYAARAGTRDIALVSTDTYRIGAQEQLHTYGRLLGVPVHTAADATQLSETLKKLRDRKLVLIDTAGMAPRDRKLAAQFAALKSIPAIKTHLVMAANSQASDLDEAVRRFGESPLSGCMLTKLDEANRIGGALSVVIRHKLPLSYLCDGQRVPEDLHLARADQLVVRAQELARLTPAALDDTTLALQFGSAAHAA